MQTSGEAAGGGGPAVLSRLPGTVSQHAGRYTPEVFLEALVMGPCWILGGVCSIGPFWDGVYDW